MFLEIDFGRPETIDRVAAERPPDQAETRMALDGIRAKVVRRGPKNPIEPRLDRACRISASTPRVLTIDASGRDGARAVER